jgi:hypothetical protein
LEKLGMVTLKDVFPPEHHYQPEEDEEMGEAEEAQGSPST